MKQVSCSRVWVEGLGGIALEDLAFFIDVVTLSVDRRRLGVGLQAATACATAPGELDVVGVEVSNDAPTRPWPAFVDRVSLPVVRLRNPPEPIGVLSEDRHRLVRDPPSMTRYSIRG